MRQGKPPLPNASTHIRHIRRSAWVTTTQWRRTLPYWVGAILVGIAAVSFAALADAAAQLRTNVLSWDPRVMILVMPFGLGLATWLTRRFFRSAQGSGIPQTIATLNTEDFTLVGRILSLRVALAKIFMTVFGIAVGASIGREGPTVQIGAAIMHAFSRLTGTVNVTMRRGAILAGGAAGISAAFNTPLAGIVFAIEELTHSFEQRTSGTMLTSVIISGVTALALVGNYSYFGHTNVEVPVGTAWAAVLGCGIFGGIAGGCFSATLVQFSQGRPRFISAYAQARPIKFAMLCGLVLAVIGLISHGATYGTGYAQARAIIDGREHYPASFFLYKLSATVVSYWSGIPGGIFAPSLSVGAGIGGWISQFLPHTSAGAVVLLGVVGYFSAVVQAPLTATVIVMEMSDNQQVTLAFMATSFLAFGVSRVICKKSLYGALAERFMTSFSPSSPSNETAPHPQDVAPASDEALPSPEEQSPPSH